MARIKQTHIQIAALCTIEEAIHIGDSAGIQSTDDIYVHLGRGAGIEERTAFSEQDHSAGCLAVYDHLCGGGRKTAAQLTVQIRIQCA